MAKNNNREEEIPSNRRNLLSKLLVKKAEEEIKRLEKHISDLKVPTEAIIRPKGTQNASQPDCEELQTDPNQESAKSSGRLTENMESNKEQTPQEASECNSQTRDELADKKRNKEENRESPLRAMQTKLQIQNDGKVSVSTKKGAPDRRNT